MATATLHPHPEQKLPLHRLPFVNTAPGKTGLSFWAVPRKGGYTGGTKTGQALARFYMKHLRAHGPTDGGTLQSIVLDMFGCELSDCPEQNSLRGQAVGFFAEMDVWLAASAKHLEGGLDRQSSANLLQAANEGLNFDEEAYLNTCEDEYLASLDKV